MNYPADSTRQNSDFWRRILQEIIVQINGEFVPLQKTVTSEKLPGGPVIPEEKLIERFLSQHSAEEWISRLTCRMEQTNDEKEQDFLPPIVDEQLQNFRADIQRESLRTNRPFLRKLPWPGGKPFAVALTHDVDLTRKYGVKTVIRSLVRGKIGEFAAGSAEILSGKNSYWTFPELLELYRTRGWRATFFFLARAWEGRSYRYDIRHRKFRRLFEQLLSRGHEIGLHSSKFAFDHPERILQEKQRLESVSGTLLTGVRQHYLRLQFPEGWKHFAEAGILYDSSCGSNHRVGFAAGTSFPFPAFDAARQQEYPLYEIPFSLMDYAWIRPGEDEDATWQRFLNVAGVVQRVGGLLNILWHPNNLAEPLFRPYWEKMIDWLNNTDFYQDTLSNILQWWKKRAQVGLEDFVPDEKGFRLVLSSREPVENLTLEIVSSRSLNCPDAGVQLHWVNSSTLHLTISQLEPGRRVLFLTYED